MHSINISKMNTLNYEYRNHTISLKEIKKKILVVIILSKYLILDMNYEFFHFFFFKALQSMISYKNTTIIHDCHNFWFVLLPSWLNSLYSTYVHFCIFSFFLWIKLGYSCFKKCQYFLSKGIQTFQDDLQWKIY